MKVRFTLVSGNTKTGPIPVSMTERSSCWQGCAFYGNGCYAEHYPTSLWWEKLEHGVGAIGWQEFCTQVAALPPGTLWRHNQAGDLPGEGRRIDRAQLDALVEANRGKRGFTYTHKPVLSSSYAAREARAAIASANISGFTVNLSGNSPAHADRLAALEIGPVVTVLPHEQERRSVKVGRRRYEWTESLAAWRDRIAHLPTTTPGGRRIAQCPATYTDTTCKECGACAQLRDAVIGFPAHGPAWRKAEAAAAAA